jgi:hypothetical protein
MTVQYGMWLLSLVVVALVGPPFWLVPGEHRNADQCEQDLIVAGCPSPTPTPYAP